MATPEFITELRRDIGTAELWLPGVSAVVLRHHDDAGTPLTTPEVLLVRRSDTGAWTVTSGILEPGEDPAPAGVREVEEETGVVASAVRIAGVWAMPPIQYPNGDRCRYLDTVMEFRFIAGQPRVNDDESLEVGWFAADSLPSGFGDHQRMKVQWALDQGAAARFITEDTPHGDPLTGRDLPSVRSRGHAG